MIKHRFSTKSETGGVSIFIVIFTALLMTIVTTSFIQIMVRNQQQATNSDLSQSAYDAALAGVEDAKRLLLHLDACSRSGASCNPNVAAIKTALSSDDCDTLEKGGLDVSFSTNNGEVPVGGPDDNQAYTCVTIKTNTPSVDDKLTPRDNSKTIPLRGVTPFDSIQLSWYTGKDVKDGNNSTDGTATDPTVSWPSLPADPAWESNDGKNNTPPIMRAQLIQYKKGENIDLGTFSSKGTTNARTAFLYPSFLAGDSTTVQPYFNQDSRLNVNGAGNVPRTAHCDNGMGDTYKCSVILALPDPVGGDEDSRTAYLQLGALYLNIPTSFEVKLFNGSTPVDFDNVQPIVDSTGRASDLFRRVRANVSINSVPLPVPDAALNVNGDLCKNFVVTNKPEDYVPGCT